MGVALKWLLSPRVSKWMTLKLGHIVYQIFEAFKISFKCFLLQHATTIHVTIITIFQKN
jgi:hypothetical protein